MPSTTSPVRASRKVTRTWARTITRAERETSGRKRARPETQLVDASRRVVTAPRMPRARVTERHSRARHAMRRDVSCRSRPRVRLFAVIAMVFGLVLDVGVASDLGFTRDRHRPLGARFKVEIAKLRVSSPSSVSGTYDIAIANFGRTLYGAQLSGMLTYPSDDTQRLGCGAAAKIDIPAAASARMAIILLLDRGGCPFTEKVINGQNAGADAVIIVDDRNEPLLTMDAASDAGESVENITIPAALLTKSDGSSFESAISANERVIGTMDWHDVLPHPDSRVEWELWSETNDECGRSCEEQNAFLRDFKPIAQSLEKGGYTQFTPHYLTWECIDDPPTSTACAAQCINVGRYCAPDPDDDLSSGYSGADVVIDNLRALCVFDVVNKTGTPWLWWDYVSDFSEQCTMDNGKFAMRSCAESVARNIGIDVNAINDCIGDTSADRKNPMLEAQIELQSPPLGSTRPNIRLLPTILINEERYSGKVARGEVLSALCAGFEEHSIPSMCSDAALMHAKCVRGQEGDTTCQADLQGDGKTSCQEVSSFPYFECICPDGSQSVVGQNGKETCQAVNMCAQAMRTMPNCSCDRCVCTNLERGRFQCKEENRTVCDAPLERGATSQGGCWASAGFSACVDNIDAKKRASREGGNPDSEPSIVCKCPKGFQGDGHSCVEVNECDTKCKGANSKCTNTYGSYNCTCADGFVANYQPEPVDDWVCLSQHRSGGAKLVLTSVAMSVLAVVSASYAFVQYRARSYMDKEIRQIMAQYMPLDTEPGDDDNDEPYDQPPIRPPRVEARRSGSLLPLTNVQMSDF